MQTLVTRGVSPAQNNTNAAHVNVHLQAALEPTVRLELYFGNPMSGKLKKKKNEKLDKT